MVPLKGRHFTPKKVREIAMKCSISLYFQTLVVYTFFFARDTTPGEKAYHFMSKGINEYDRTILVCSRQSLERLPVMNELDLVLSRESREGGSSRLIPVTLDRYLYDGWTPRNTYMKTSVLDRCVCNFIGSDNHDEPNFIQALERLLLALKKVDQ
jgi:hypothetical protein